MRAHYGAFSQVMQATTRSVLEAMDEAKGDFQALLIELRARSLSKKMGSKIGRAPSRSLEEFVNTMSTNTITPKQDEPGGRASFVSISGSFAPSTPPGSGVQTTSSRLSFTAMESSDLLELPPAVDSASGDQASEAPVELVSMDFASDVDPFAGNDLRDLAATATATEDATDANEPEDPFACLMSE